MMMPGINSNFNIGKDEQLRNGETSRKNVSASTLYCAITGRTE